MPRQVKNEVQVPPMMTPRIAAAPCDAVNTAYARRRTGPSGSRTFIREKVDGIRNAQPSPSIPRAAASKPRSGATTARALPSANTHSPPMQVRRRPYISATCPPRIRKPAKVIDAVAATQTSDDWLTAK
jgi:hypothetical protein